MNLTIEVQGQPLKGDVLIYNGKAWETVSQSHITSLLSKRTRELQSELDTLKDEIKTLKDGVNEKLEMYHKILQNLVKGE